MLWPQRSLRPVSSLALVLAALASGCCTAPRPRATPPSEGSPDAYRALLETLASDAYEGRGVDTEGNRKAAELLTRAFRDAGLEPAGDGGDYLQCFSHPVRTRVDALELRRTGQGTHAAAAEVAESALGTAPFSESAPFEGDLLFLGYGIHAPDAGYSDYEGVDVRGKVLLLLRYEPRERDPKSPLNGDRPSRYSALRRKVFEARGRGAVAVIFVSPPREGEPPDRKVPRLSPTEAQSSAGLPVLHLLPSVADAWLTEAGTSLQAEVQRIDAEMKSHPVPLGHVTGRVALSREERRLCNVVGRVPGAGALAKEAVVVGAHFDHLGYGQAGSMAPGSHEIHNGADDNASGAAALPVLAARLKERLGDDHRTLIFAAFNGEEVGLAGSSHYVEAPPFPLSDTDLMVNLDMIGRLRDDEIIVFGTESGTEIEGWTQAAAKAVGLHLKTHGDGYGPSDQTPFYSHGVPVLHFFTGAHEDYHRPTDDADKIHWAGAEKVLDVVTRVVHTAATSKARVAYRESKSGPSFAGDSRGYGAWLGTIPDYTAMSPGTSGGVKISGVVPGGPAKAAGLRGGDVIKALGGRSIDNLYDMTFVLRDHKPGDVIEVVVERGGERLTLAATLGDRAHRGKGHGKGHGGHHGASQDQAAPAGGHGPHGGEPAPPPSGPKMDPKTLLYPGEERHLKDLRQLTFEGENAEAYFSPDGRHLVFQARGGDVPCDRIYTYDLETGRVEAVSSGKGRTTCAYYTYPKGESILYASTHAASAACPPEPDHSQGYVWAVYPDYDIYLRTKDAALRPLITGPGYDAEATVCFRDGRVVFTSDRDGDLELYLFDLAHPGRPPRRLTHTPGYDGGAFFSPDCKRLVWRASRPKGEALEDYRRLLARHLVRPSHMEIFVGRDDASDARQVTHNGAANFAPYFLPDSRRVIFASNVGDPHGRNFDLYVIDPNSEDPDATLERVTFSPVFEAFPMFSPDGKTLVFSSNRNGKHPGDTNLFIATWVE